MRTLFGALLIVGALHGAGAGEAPSRSAAAPRASTAAARRAVELYRQSEIEYREGRFSEAAVLLEEAYALLPQPVLLYNLGRAAENGGELERAVEAYVRYLGSTDRVQDRAAIEKKLEVLRALLAERAALRRKAEDATQTAVALEASAAATARALSPPPRRRIVAPWALSGAGALVGLGGGALLGVAASQHRQAVDATIQLRAAELDDQSRRLLLSGAVVAGIGGAVLVAGVVWGLVATAQARRP